MQLLSTFLFLLFLPFSCTTPMKETLNTSVTQISNQCTNLTVRSGWLVGDCLTGVDATTRIQSAVWLENKIAVKIGNATLRWSIE